MNFKFYHFNAYFRDEDITECCPSLGTDAYPHMPILRPHDTRISSLTFTSAHRCGNDYMRVGVARALAYSSDFELLGSKVPQNGRFPALDADEPPDFWCRPYSFILGGEIRNRTKNKHTNSNRYIHTLPIGIRG